VSSLTPPAARRERLERSETLRRTENYRRCYASGRRKGGSFVLLYSLPNESGAPRLGITASGKVGPAVTRHRLKRWAREIYRRYLRREELPAVDLIVHMKPDAARATFADFRGELERLLAGQLPASRSSRPSHPPGLAEARP
jgi:ribonuclease P protein component